MNKKNYVIIIPGLGNGVVKHKWATDSWKKYNIYPIIFDAKWKTEENGLQEKLSRALQLIDSLKNKGTKISLVGNSAGSSLALNIFSQRKNLINKIIINCGRIRDGDWPWFTFDQATKSSPSFKESVLKAQEIEKNFTDIDRKKILTLRPIFDETVPYFTVPILGARNEIMPMIEHVVTIGLNITLFKKRIIDFIKVD